MKGSLSRIGIFVCRLNNTNRYGLPIYSDTNSPCRSLMVDFLIPRDEHRWVKWMPTTLRSTRNHLEQRREDMLGYGLIEGFSRD